MQTEPMHSRTATVSDPALLRGIGSGDEQALLGAIAKYGPVLFGLATRLLRSPELAEEIVQDVFVTLWQRPERYDPVLSRVVLRLVFRCDVMTRPPASVERNAFNKEEAGTAAPNTRHDQPRLVRTTLKASSPKLC